MLYRLTRAFLQLLFSADYRWRAAGLEHLPPPLAGLPEKTALTAVNEAIRQNLGACLAKAAHLCGRGTKAVAV